MTSIGTSRPYGDARPIHTPGPELSTLEDLESLLDELKRLETEVSAGSSRSVSPEPPAAPVYTARPVPAAPAVHILVPAPVPAPAPAPVPAAPLVSSTIDVCPEAPSAGVTPSRPDHDSPSRSVAPVDDDGLGGDFESVADVLSGVFGEVATFVETFSAMDATVLGGGGESDSWRQEPAAAAPVIPTSTSAEPVAVPVAVPVAALPSEAPAPPPSPPRLSRLRGLVEPPCITVLSRLNYPLRALPPRLRPLADWLALTLAFWVPVVWAIVLFMGGSEH